LEDYIYVVKVSIITWRHKKYENFM